MSLRNTEVRWGSVSKWLHWSVAVLMIAAMVCSLWADRLDPEVEWHRTLWQWLIVRLHKPLGFLAMLLIFLRFFWMLANPRPDFPESMSRHEVWLSRVVHVSLYALMLLVPVSGWFMSQYAGSPINFFGLFEIGNLVGENDARVGQLHAIHVPLGLVTVGLVVLHVAAALFHAWVRRDGVLTAMLPSRQQSR